MTDRFLRTATGPCVTPGAGPSSGTKRDCRTSQKASQTTMPAKTTTAMRPMRSGGGSSIHGTSKVNQVFVGQFAATTTAAQKEDQTKQDKDGQGNQAGGGWAVIL